LVLQPHTSAGRIPTAAGYRYYVDHLGPGRLRHAAQERINSFFGEVHLELSKLLRATSDLLVEITDLPAVVVAPGVTFDKVRALHTVQISADQILLVVVTDGGRVVQQRGRVRVPVTPVEVEEAQRIVAETVVGKELGGNLGVRSEVLVELANPTLETVLTITDCLHLASSTGTDVFIGGTQRMATVWDDSTTVQRVLEILEREAEVMKLLAGASGTSIQIGSESEDPDFDIAVVSKKYDTAGDGGSVGVIGPMRMNYKRAISAVEEVSKELEEQIGTRSD
jgi:heat-inducible transcriptional repressor